ncbi:MAG: methyltransferase domain-containing protein, partial [Chloroflexi bacterium]|nr:methyltransferase domain-containing protein [Chloroflexota bacterium]
VRPLLGSATALPLADSSVDAVMMGFTLRNVGDVSCALGELLRVLRPDGRLVVLELSTPAPPPLRAAYRLYFHHLAPRIAGLLGGDQAAYEYLPRSVDRFPRPEALARLLTERGFRRVRFESLSFGIATIHIAER